MSIIEFREPIESDILPLMALARGYKHKYLADSEILPDDPNLLIKEHGFNLEVMYQKYTIVFVKLNPDGSEEVIGSADFTDIDHDLKAVIHFIMNPRYIRRFLKDRVYLDALLDRFRVLRVKKIFIESEFFCTTAHKLGESIGFRKVATLTDIVRQKIWDGKTFHYVVGDLYYYELTRKDLAEAIRAHFVAEELIQETPNVIQQEKIVKRPRAKKSKQPVRNADKQGEECKLQPDLPARTAGHSKASTPKRGQSTRRSVAISDAAVSGSDEQISWGSELVKP